MKKSTRMVLWILLVLGVGVLAYQALPIRKKVNLLEPPAKEGILKGTVSNTSYKYVLIDLMEQDSTIFVTEGNSTRSVGLHVIDTVEIVDGAFSYHYRLKEAYVFPRIIYLANDSGACEVVYFQNPYLNRPCYMGAICMDRGAEIQLTIDGRDLQHAKISGSPGMDAIFKRDAENDAKAQAAAKALSQKKQTSKARMLEARRAKQVNDSIQKAKRPYDSARVQMHGRTSIFYLKPKSR